MDAERGPRRSTALEAAARLAEEHDLPHGDMAVLKDSSNLLVHLAPSPGREAVALRDLQLEVWTALHDARRLALPGT